MNRVGFFTGKIYKDGELPEVGECCFCVTDEELKDEEEIKQKRLGYYWTGCTFCNPNTACEAKRQAREEE